MDNDFVTGVRKAPSSSVTMTCQGVTLEAAEPARAARLEDVEKLVRSLEQRLAELEVWSLDIVDRLMTRIEVLELEREFDHDHS